MTNGMCGADVRWRLEWDAQDHGTLTIYGTGPMYDYGVGLPPWEFDKDAITTIAIQEGVTHVGAFSFNECVDLVTLSLPTTLQSVGEGAFAGCVKLGLPKLAVKAGSLPYEAQQCLDIVRAFAAVCPDAFEGCPGLPDNSR